MKEKVIELIQKERIIVIVRNVAKDKLIPMAQAMYDGGIRLIEITYSADKSTSDEETAENIKMLADYFGEKMYIGAGTVLTEEQVELTKKAGGKFIISPDTYPEVIRKTCELGLVSIPGSMTASEAQIAHRNGADFIKLFPMSNVGVDYFKAIKAPLSHIKFLAVGGINLENMDEYISAGICGFGLGSNIVNKKMIENNDFEGIKALAESYVKKLKN